MPKLSNVRLQEWCVRGLVSDAAGKVGSRQMVVLNGEQEGLSPK